MTDSSRSSSTPAVAVEPSSRLSAALEQAVADGGGRTVPVTEADALIWADPSAPEQLPAVVARNAELRWVSLPFSGIEPYLDHLDRDRVWTCARGVYARPVAEHALMLGLAGMRGLATYARADRWEKPEGINLIDGRVTIFGGGGIARELIDLLAGFRCSITVVRRTAEPVAGADRTLTFDQRIEAVADADLVVLALPLTPETHHVIGADELKAMAAHAWLVNVARGGNVDTEALLAALDTGEIGGACLDVTDPEPLPEGHPLWSHPRVLITPHIGNTPEMGLPLLAAHVRRNVELFAAGRPLEGVIDVEAGY